MQNPIVKHVLREEVQCFNAVGAGVCVCASHLQGIPHVDICFSLDVSSWCCVCTIDIVVCTSCSGVHHCICVIGKQHRFVVLRTSSLVVCSRVTMEVKQFNKLRRYAFLRFECCVSGCSAAVLSKPFNIPFKNNLFNIKK